MNQVYLSDIPRLFTAAAEWCACLVFILNRPRRFSGPRLWSLLGLGLVLQCVFLQATAELHIALWLPCMAGAVGLMFFLIAACCGIPLPGAVYFTACAFLTAEFAASLEWQLWSYTRHLLGLEAGAGHTMGLSLVFLAAVYAGVFGLMYWLQARRKDPDTALVFQPKDLRPPVLISAASFLMSNLSFVYSNIPFTSSAIEGIYNIRTLMDLAGVAMLYAYHVQRCELHAQRELDAMQNILQNQYIQYKQSRESIDVVNRKYHDLKHQIAVLRVEPDAQRRLDFLDGMEEEIRTYEAQNKTGNSVLDNAIECELTIQDKKKRLIHLAVYAKRDFLVIQCGNYCEDTPEFQDGLPVSTKGDGAYHGFGVKSIRRAAEKYGGTMTIHTRDSWFELNIVIPIKAPIV